MKGAFSPSHTCAWWPRFVWILPLSGLDDSHDFLPVDLSPLRTRVPSPGNYLQYEFALHLRAQLLNIFTHHILKQKYQKVASRHGLTRLPQFSFRHCDTYCFYFAQQFQSAMWRTGDGSMGITTALRDVLACKSMRNGHNITTSVTLTSADLRRKIQTYQRISKHLSECEIHRSQASHACMCTLDAFVFDICHSALRPNKK